MMTYTTNKNEVFYDFNMIAELLRVHPSSLKRAIKKYAFNESDYIRYQNRNLYSQDAVIDFTIYIITNKLITDVRRLETEVNKK